MTNYTAYDAGLPCKNRACKSYGRPHPNCQCWGQLAEGGEVHFCADTRPHQAGCELFADGGDVATPPPAISQPAPSGSPDGEADASMPAPEPSVSQPAPAKPLWDADAKNVEPPPADVGVWDADAKPVSAEPTWDDDAVPAAGKYETPAQQVATAFEGAAQGVLGPLATAGELGYGKLGDTGKVVASTLLDSMLPGLGTEARLLDTQGMTAEDIAGRQAANPWEHGLAEGAGLVVGMATGGGEAALAGKVASRVAAGSALLRGAIANGLLQAGDEVSNWMLGQGDPSDPIGAATAHIGAASLLGAVGGAAGSSASKAFKAVAQQQIGLRAASFLEGLAAAAENANPEFRQAATEMAKTNGLNMAAHQAGQDFFDKTISRLVPSGAGLAGGVIKGYHDDGLWGAAREGIVGAIMGGVANKVASKFASRVVAPTLMKVLASGHLAGVAEAIDHAIDVERGSQAINKAINGLFTAGGQQAVSGVSSARDREKLDEFIRNGGITQSIQQQVYKQNAAPQVAQPQGFAEGGEVLPAPASAGKAPEVRPALGQDDGVAVHFPQQNLVLQSAKTRVSNYLQGMRPQEDQPRYAFDRRPDTSIQQRKYERALSVANSPLSLFDDVHGGTLSLEKVAHFKGLYPELYNLVQRRMTERIAKAQIAGEKPSRLIRQGISGLTGIPMTRNLSPEGIQAIQATFQRVSAAAAAADAAEQQQKPAKGKTTKASLTKSDQAYMTSSQAREARQQRD